MRWKAWKKHWLTKTKLFGLCPKAPLKTKTAWRVLNSVSFNSVPQIKKVYRVIQPLLQQDFLCVSLLPSSQMWVCSSELPLCCLSHPAWTSDAAQGLRGCSQGLRGDKCDDSLLCSVQEECKYYTASLDSKRKKKKRDFRVLSTAHDRARGRLHYIPVNSRIHFFFLWEISFISSTKSGENHFPVHLPFSPPPILSSTKMFH